MSEVPLYVWTRLGANRHSRPLDFTRSVHVQSRVDIRGRVDIQKLVDIQDRVDIQTEWTCRALTRPGRIRGGPPARISAAAFDFIFTRINLGGVSREQKMLKGHLPRVIHHQLY